MTVTKTQLSTPWLLLMFSLPTKRASERVKIWRRLKRYGAVGLPGSGYLLPNSAANRERFEWLATAIRKFQGLASVAQVHALDNQPDEKLQQLFNDARSRDYQEVLSGLRKLGLKKRSSTALGRLRKRLQEIAAIDFFHSPLRSRAENVLAQAQGMTAIASNSRRGARAKEYTHRTWITRPRPGIDRVASAWLIQRFIDGDAKFIFDNDAGRHPRAIPFDMFCAAGFGHRGDDCTFETLVKEFAIRNQKVTAIAGMIHDADLEDEKFGRVEGMGLDRVLIGWAAQGVTDDELLRRGVTLIEGLYESVS
jgi:hypothetical protein